MKKRVSMKKVVRFAGWFSIICGMTTLLVAANNNDKARICKRVAITVKTMGEGYFIDKNDIAQTLKQINGKRVVHQMVDEMDLRKLERQLEKNPWIASAQLYLDGQNVLHVTVTERQPIARVFTTSGSSFYMDSAACRMPTLPGVSVRVPVVTNFPTSGRLHSKDSALLQEVKTIASYVGNDSFWKAQIAQIDIMPNRNFELLPTIGNHVIRIGTAENLDQKLHRLFVFYQQVMSRTGFDRYSALDVQFEGQVVAVHKGTVSTVDSLQLLKNINDLIKRSLVQEEEMQGQADGEDAEPAASAPNTDSVLVHKVLEKKPEAAMPATNKPAGTKTEIKKKPAAKPVSETHTKAKESLRKPKAVMPARH